MSVNSLITNVDSQISGLKNRIKKLRDTEQAYRDQLSRLEEVRRALQPLCEQSKAPAVKQAAPVPYKPTQKTEQWEMIRDALLEHGGPMTIGEIGVITGLKSNSITNVLYTSRYKNMFKKDNSKPIRWSLTATAARASANGQTLQTV